MIPVLIIGVAWLAVTAVLCVLIGRAIRHADQQDEDRAWATKHAGSHPRRVGGSRAHATIWAPYPHELLRPPGISSAGGRDPLLFRLQNGDDLPPDMPPPRLGD